MKTLAAIPCYNEEATIGSVVLKARRHVDEVLVVDDGSVDDTVGLAKAAGANVVEHGGNKGYGAAIQSCFQYAREHDVYAMVILDGDGQHDPAQIPSVLKPLLDGEADVTIGSRFLKEKHIVAMPRHRRLGISIISKLGNIGSGKGNGVTDAQSGFRGYSREAIDTIEVKDNDMGGSMEILFKARKNGLSIEEVPISCRYDVDGSTKSPFRHGIGVLVSMLQYAEVEHSLLFFGVPGLILFTVGLVYGLRVYDIMMETGEFAIGSALITVVLLVFGVLSGITGLILHAVINAARRKWR